MKQAELLDEDDAIKEDVKVTTSDLTHRLYRKFDTSEDAITQKYIVATQVRPMGSHGDSTADAVIVGNWPSVGYEIQGFEIKISRSDWLNEVKEPNKCIRTKQYCDRWWLLIASQAMYKEQEIPEDWGVMVAHGKGIKVVKQAPKLTPVSLTPQFISGLMRANKRGHIAEDLHAQYLNDAKRKAEQQAKKENEDLRHFVKFIHEAFGVELKQDKRWNHETHEDVKEWVAKVSRNYNNLTPEEIRDLIKSALNSDLEKVQTDLGSAYHDLVRAMETLKKYEGKGF